MTVHSATQLPSPATTAATNDATTETATSAVRARRIAAADLTPGPLPGPDGLLDV